MNKLSVNVDYLMKLALNELTDDEVIKGFFVHYFCQGRTIDDMKVDYISRVNNKYIILNDVQIKKSLNKVIYLLNEYTIREFNQPINYEML